MNEIINQNLTFDNLYKVSVLKTNYWTYVGLTAHAICRFGKLCGEYIVTCNKSTKHKNDSDKTIDKYSLM